MSDGITTPARPESPGPLLEGDSQSRHARINRRRRVVLWSVLVVLGFVWTLALAFLQFEWRAIEDNHLDRSKLYAKVLESQTSRELSAAASRIAVAADQLSTLGSMDGAQRHSVLRDAVSKQPLLRSLSLVSESGRVLASSNPDNVEQSLAWSDWGGVPRRIGQTTLGPWQPRRDLADPPGTVTTASSVPMLLLFESEARQPLVLLALVNPDYFATQHDLLLDDTSWRAAVMRLDGSLISSTAAFSAAPGASANATRTFQQYLPAKEHGQYVGQGIDGDTVVTAFRVLRNWPLVSVVEQPHALVQREFKLVQQGTFLLALGISLLSGLAAWAQLRSERREAVGDEALARREAQVQASEARKEAILRSALDGIVSIDAQGLILDVNPSAESMFRRDRAAMLGRPMHELIVPPRHRQAHQQGMARYRSGAPARVLNKRIEIEAMRADGSEFPVELTIVPVRTAEGEIFTATLRDITERRQAEIERTSLLNRIGNALTELQRQRLALDEHAIVGIADARGVLTYANSKLAQVSGYPVDDLVGSPYLLLIADADLPDSWSQRVLWRADASHQVKSDILQSLREGRVWEGELLHLRKDGSPFWAASTIVPMRDEQGTLEQVFVIQTDITQLIEAERKVAEARELEVHIGGRIQQALLVTRPDQRLPQTWISSFSRPSRGIDGDFVEVLTVGAHCVDVVMGDVMGKGVGAALIGAATKMQLGHCIAELMTAHRDGNTLPQPVDVLSALHREMVASLRSIDAFVTLCYLRIDSEANTVTWVGCGHEETLLVRSDGMHLTLKNQHPPLGVLDSFDCEQSSLPLSQGDALFVCSDGIYDALRPDGSRLGSETVLAKVRDLLRKHHTPAAVLHRLRSELLNSEMRATDDMTMILAMRTGPTELESRRELPVSLDGVHHVRSLVAARATAAGLVEPAMGLFCVACVEAFTNIVRHATGREADMPVELIVRTLQDALVVEFVYIGDSFELPVVVAETNFDDYPEGGFGMTIIRQASDQVEYGRIDGVNTVRLTRYI